MVAHESLNATSQGSLAACVRSLTTFRIRVYGATSSKSCPRVSNETEPAMRKKDSTAINCCLY